VRTIGLWAAAVAALGIAAQASCSQLVEPLPTPDAGAAPGSVLTRTDPSCVAPAYGNYVVYQAQGDNHLFRLEAKPNGNREDISVRLDALSTGSDEFINVSPDGDWLVVGSTRFGCDQSCIALVSRDACTAQVVVADGKPLPSEATAAVTSKGEAVVYPAEPPPGGHSRDLFVVKRNGTGWTSPTNLTAGSPGAWNQRPAVSDDGTKIIFDCGPDANSQGGTALCEIGLDGQGLRTIKPADLGGTLNSDTYIAHGDYAPDGAFVFEGTLTETQQLWRLAGAKHGLLNPDYISDTQPCVLPSGQVVSVWAGRSSTGVHELKITGADGSSPELLLGGVDVVDEGIGCSR
jgi:hypothetical protein